MNLSISNNSAPANNGPIPEEGKAPNRWSNNSMSYTNTPLGSREAAKIDKEKEGNESVRANLEKRIENNIEEIARNAADPNNNLRPNSGFSYLVRAICDIFSKGNLDKKLFEEILGFIENNLNKKSGPEYEAFFMLNMGIKRLMKEENFGTLVKIMPRLSPEEQVDFVFSTLFPPYQLRGESSCFASAELMTLWNNSPSKWMRFIFNIIKTNKADFNLFFDDSKKYDGKLVVDVSPYGNKYKGSPIQTHQKALSAIASFAANQDTKDKVSKQLKDGALKIIVNNSGDVELFWKIQKLIKSFKSFSKMVWNCGTWMPFSGIPEMWESITSLYEKCGNYLRIGGGKQSLIISKLSRDGIVYSKIVDFKNPKERLGSFRIPISKAEEIFQVLQKLEPESLIPLSFFSEKVNHGISAIAQSKDTLRKMKVGEIILFGLTNFANPSCIYMKKLDEKTVQLTSDKEGNWPLSESPIDLIAILTENPNLVKAKSAS